MKKSLRLVLIFIMLFAMVITTNPIMAAVSNTDSAQGIVITNPNGTPVPDHITLTWTEDPMTTQTVTWRTDTTVEVSKVQYEKDSGKLILSEKAALADGITQKFAAGGGDMNIHTATIKGLEPGQKYIYRVGDGVNWSEVNSFTTEAKDTSKFKFLIFGDSQSGAADNFNYLPYRNTLENALRANPDAKFMVNVGDLVDTGNNYIHWNNWFDAAKGYISNIPFMPVHGNHETFNPPKNSKSIPIYFLAQFMLPQNGAEHIKTENYSYDYGNVHIVVLDSQGAEESKLRGYDILEEQAAWLDNDLKNTNKPWKIVFFHKTPYYNKAVRANNDVKDAFSPIFDKYHIDFVFNAHDHTVARTYPIYNDKFVSKPSEGTVYYVVGRSGNKHYIDVSQRVWDQFYYDPQDQPNYLLAEVDNNKFTVKVMKQDGTLIDSYTIDKDANRDYPQTIIPAKYQDTRLVIFGLLLRQPEIKVFPYKVNDKWYIPARSFVQFLGGSATWLGNGKVALQIGKINAELLIGSTEAKLNGKDISIPDGAINDKGTTMVSADVLSELFGYSYKYDDLTNMIMFSSLSEED